MMPDAGNEKPPVAGSWMNLYLLLAGVLALLIAVFYFFTKHFE